LAEDTIPRFEAEYGVRVRYGICESNGEMLAKVMSGNSGWDVVFPSNCFIRPMLEYGLLAPLRHQWLGNLDRLDRPFQSASWDPQLRWSAPYMWGASGITYNRKLASALGGLGRSVGRAPARPDDHAGRSWRGAGGVPEEAGLLAELDQPLRVAPGAA
jgi:spermidine/putrescine-binding protein